MKQLWYVLVIILALFALPCVSAQEPDDDGGTEIEIADDDDDEKSADDDFDEEEQRKKNEGLAGGGKRDKGDPGAPKVKATLQDQINEAIRKGVIWLKKKQAKDGSYPPVTANREYGTGKDIGLRYRDELAPSAWAIYTLAKCGEKKNSSAIKKGLKYLFGETEYVYDVMGGQNAQFGGRSTPQTPSRSNPRTLTTYENAALIMMIEAVYEGSAKLTGKHRKRRLHTDNPLKPPPRSKIPKDVWKYMHNRVLFLTVGRRIKTGGARGKGGSSTLRGLQVRSGANKGGWRYGPAGQGGGSADLSATQFALLALRAASQAGYPVEKVAKGTWYDAAQYVKRCQRGDGGFTYQLSGGSVSGGMTACGVGCLLICKEQMILARDYDDDARSPPAWIDESIKRGMDWLDKNFDHTRNPGGRHHFYYLYGIERIGDLTGRKEFNGKDWYVRGAKLLIQHQGADGSWMDGTEAFPPRDVNSTTLALLFLKRATIPVVTVTEKSE